MSDIQFLFKQYELCELFLRLPLSTLSSLDAPSYKAHWTYSILIRIRDIGEMWFFKGYIILGMLFRPGNFFLFKTWYDSK